MKDTCLVKALHDKVFRFAMGLVVRKLKHQGVLLDPPWIL